MLHVHHVFKNSNPLASFVLIRVCFHPCLELFVADSASGITVCSCFPCPVLEPLMAAAHFPRIPTHGNPRLLLSSNIHHVHSPWDICSGRRKACLLYVFSYSLSCLTKYSGDYWILLLGRLLGGIATSLLFSAFEAWLVAEHVSRGYSESLLGDTFTKAVFLGAGLMAILSGLVSMPSSVDQPAAYC